MEETAFWVVFTTDAPVQHFGSLLRKDLPPSVEASMGCSKVEAGVGGLLELTPEGQPRDKPCASVLIHPRHVLCILRMGRMERAGF